MVREQQTAGSGNQTQKHKQQILKHAPENIKDLKSTIQGMWKQITHGVSDPVKNKFEETLSYFDKMHAVRSKRALTADEQDVYDRTRKVIIARFEDMFERAEPAVNARRNMKREDIGHHHHGHKHHNNHNKRTARKTSMRGGGDTIWEMAMKFPIWVWDGLKAMINSILSFFGSVFNEKQKLFMEYFSPSRLMKTVGVTSSDPDGAVVKLDGITAKIGQSIEKLQRTVVGGVSGAATASMDMILNAFSMMPGIGTTLLVWRMFQNLLVIIGASLSVQSGQTEGSNAVSDTINGAKSSANTGVVNAAATEETKVNAISQTATDDQHTRAAEGGKVSEADSKLMEERTKTIPKDAFAVLADDNSKPATPLAVVKIVKEPPEGGEEYTVKLMAKQDESKPNETKERKKLISEGELDLMLETEDKESAKAAKAAIEEAKKAAPPPAADAKAPPAAAVDAKAPPAAAADAKADAKAPPPAAAAAGGKDTSPKPEATKKGGGKATKSTDVTTANVNAVRASARALNQSLKRFSGMSTRVSSLLMKESKKTKQKTPRNPLSLLTSTSAAASSSLTGYALKPLSISRFIHA